MGKRRATDYMQAPGMNPSAVQRTQQWPSADPSHLTTEAVDRAVENLQRLLESRLDGMDKATELKVAPVERIPLDIADAVGHLRELHGERFSSIMQMLVDMNLRTNTQFTERDIRTEQAGKASTEALAAALQAAKELVGAQGEASAAAAIKSETAFTKQFEQIVATITTLTDAIDKRITELKERIDRGEGSDTGAKETRIEAREVRTETRGGQNLGLIIGSLAFGAIGTITAVVVAITSR